MKLKDNKTGGLKLNWLFKMDYFIFINIVYFLKTYLIATILTWILNINATKTNTRISVAMGELVT